MQNLESISTCGHCNVGAEGRNAVESAIKKTYDACQAAYGIPAKLPTAPEVKEVEASKTSSVKAAETSATADAKAAGASASPSASKAAESSKAAEASKAPTSGAGKLTGSACAIAVAFAAAPMG